MPFIPVQPLISNLATTSFLITKSLDGNPGSTFYVYRVTTGSTVKYLNSLGVLQDDLIFLDVDPLLAQGLTPNTTYSVDLAAADDAAGTNQTSFSPAAVAVTLATIPAFLPYRNIFSTTAMPDWGNNQNPDGTDYFVELSTDPGFLVNTINSGWITTLGFTFLNLDPSTIYYGRVKARNTSLVETTFLSLGTVATPAGPDTVKAIHVFNLIAERGFLLKWAPNLETNIINYKIYRSPSPTDTAAFVLLATVAPNQTIFVDNVPFTFGIVWYYKVTAVDDGGNESSLAHTTPVNDNTFHSFEEQPFLPTSSVNDFVRDEALTGIINGVNTLFTTTSYYVANTVQVYLNGVRLTHTLDYLEGPSAGQITLISPPASGDLLRVDYTRIS